MPRVNRVQKSRKNPGRCRVCGEEIGVGQPYLHYAFRYGGKHVHHVDHPPKPSHLEGSDKMQRIREVEEQASELQAKIPSEDEREGFDWSEFASDLNTMADELEEVRDEYQDALDNMGSLAESDAGYEIEEKCEALDTWADRLREAADAAEDPDEETADLIEEILSEGVGF